MSTRNVRVVLEAATQQYEAAMKRAAEATDQTSKAGQAAANAAKQAKKDFDAAQKAADEMARNQQTAFNTIGAGMATVGAAALALTGSIAKTGIEYNTLQQTSRAALSTLLGGMEAANAQMDKLDAFAKTSPFSKSTFIQAQQQMLAFGIETKKVIPYLDAVSEAVAAAGGSNQQIAEVATIMSKISSSAKITAEDLNQFGNQGIDAARLIGDQMGFTAQEIRAQITAGTLDAGEALDALAAGMKQTFDGASANVKDTMAGALDRVKAAWRDLSAAMMEPLVGQNGGGLLVDATNSFADFLRTIEKLPGPVKLAMGAVTGLVGVVGTVGGSLLLALPRIQETRKAFAELSSEYPRLAAGASKTGQAFATLAKGATIVGAAVGALRIAQEVFTDASMSAEELAGKMELVSKGAADLSEAFAGSGAALLNNRDGVESLDEAFARLAKKPDEVQYAFDGFVASLTGLETPYIQLENRLEQVGQQLANMPIADAQVQFAELRQAAEDNGYSLDDLMAKTSAYGDHVRSLAAEAGVLELSQEELASLMGGDMVQGLRLSADGTELLSGAQAEAAEAAQQHAEAQETAAKAAEEQAQAVADAAQALLDYYSAVLGAENSNIALEAAIDDATAAAAENGKTLDINTEAGRANKTALLGVAEAALRVASDMAEAGASTADIEARTQSARAQFIAAAQAMGMSADEANAYADQLGLIPKQVSTLVTTPGVNDSKKNVQDLIGVIGRVPASTTASVRVNVDPGGIYALNNTLNRINGRTYTAAAAVKVYGQGAVATGGYGGDVAAAVGLAGGGMPPHTRRVAGLLEGPGTPTSDSIPAWLSRKEFVTQAAAVAYYGTDLMYAMNRRAIPKEAFAPYGFAGGGSPSVVSRDSFAPSPAPAMRTTAVVDSSAITSAVRAGLANAVFVMDGQVIDVRLDARDAHTARRVRRGA